MNSDAPTTVDDWQTLSNDLLQGLVHALNNRLSALGALMELARLRDETVDPLSELPTEVAQLKRIGVFAEKRKIYAAYHTHLQGSMTAFDQAFAASKGNMANVDLGHYVAAGGDPIARVAQH